MVYGFKEFAYIVYGSHLSKAAKNEVEKPTRQKCTY